MSVTFKNTGNVAIDNSDFKQPLYIKVKQPTAILSADSFNTSCTTLALELNKKLIFNNSEYISVADVFLNPGDSFSIRLILSEYNNNVLQIDYKIKDILKLKEVVSVIYIRIGDKEVIIAFIAAILLFIIFYVVTKILYKRKRVIKSKIGSKNPNKSDDEI